MKSKAGGGKIGKLLSKPAILIGKLFVMLGIKIRVKLIIIFLAVSVVPLIVITVFTFNNVSTFTNEWEHISQSYIEENPAAAQEMIKLKEQVDAALEASMDRASNETTSSLITIVLVITVIAVLIASWLKYKIRKLIIGVTRLREGERQFRFEEPVKDEFGALGDSIDDMAENIENSIANPVSIINMNKKIVYMNEQALIINGKTFEEVVGDDYYKHSVYPEGSPYDPLLALRKGRDSEVYYLKSKDRYVKGSAKYLYNNDGGKASCVIETTDVTDMVREQQKTEEQRTLLDKILSASPDLVWCVDIGGRYMKVNPRFAAITGDAPEYFVGKTPAGVLPSEVSAQFSDNDNLALTKNVTHSTEDTVCFNDGHEETLDIVRTPILDSDGNVIGLLGLARNVSERVHMENQLRSTQLMLEKAVKDANSANAHKGEFLARMSHEIRTPMNAIIGLANILQRKLDAAPGKAVSGGEIVGHIGQIETSSQHLLGLLNDILDISKIEAGKIELMCELCELTKLTETVVTIIKPRCDEKKIKFVVDVDEFEPSTFKTDPLRLRQVLINLLGNAVKFTPDFGTVTFSMKRLARKDGKTLIRFIVLDNGIGIPEDQVEEIFRPFEQGSASVAKTHGGTGLGLAISQLLVELFGGTISLETKLEEGSRFSFDIWLEEAEPKNKVEVDFTDTTDKFAGKRILLVDDVDVNRIVVTSMLEETGVEIDEATDGKQAVEIFSNSAKGTYDLVLMDIQMPVMNGHDATMAIRALPRADAKKVPVIALTANAFKEDIEKALSYGMNAHLAKPIEMNLLLELLFRHLIQEQ